MHQFIEWISNLAIQLIHALGITGIFIGMILESACIPIPSEVIMLSGGAAVSTGSMTYAEVVLAGVAGNVVGSVIAYYIGAFGGRTLLERYGKYVLFNAAHFEQSQRWFERYGQSTVFFARNLPFIRTFISLPAGIARMPFMKFLLFSLLGCIPWNMALAYAGLKLGANADSIETYLHPISYALAGAAVLLLVYWLLRKRRREA
ncbi:membrane protein DedA with SNARE-associated domain [Paenibacillus taihuensis]|uniref:Membrane protein DedA with SNARE-associated domain n=1 Tax=Paenibacillus taihuensis TaxID=1156355 RepID=A0A3D9SCI5_9BACL|nr:DedA family protein [Paenibacillus taihuensis]REE91614.1 membrane protein DedA with SNARE-associated domain [Paenibacillus taihuensis]